MNAAACISTYVSLHPRLLGRETSHENLTVVHLSDEAPPSSACHSRPDQLPYHMYIERNNRSRKR
jgi:hypothetical protein